MKPPELYPYQKTGIWRMIHKFKGRVLLGDDIGLGKSVQSLRVAQHFCEDSPIVITCPNSVKFGWEIEVHKHLGLQCWILNGLKPPTQLPLHIPPVIILNWDILRGGWTDRLILLKPKVIIGDEIVAIKDGRAQRTKAFRRLCYGVPHVLLLSGSPIENGPIEFFNALNILRKDLYPSFRQFASRYSNMKVTRWGIKYEGSANEAELSGKLKDIMVRRTKREVLTDLPPLKRIMVPLEIDRKEYEEAEHNFLTWLFKQNPGKAMRVKNAVQIAKIQYLLGLIARLKLPAITEWITDFLESGKKLVVFGHHRDFLETLHDTFKDKSVLVYGGITGVKRQAAIDQFASDKKTKIFFGSITAAGMGINKLQTVSSDMVIGELIWVGMKLLQAEGRLERLGQKNPVSVYYLIARKTTEAILCKTIWKKQKSINQIVDNEPDRQEFDILEEVFQELRKERR